MLLLQILQVILFLILNKKVDKLYNLKYINFFCISIMNTYQCIIVRGMCLTDQITALAFLDK